MYRDLPSHAPVGWTEDCAVYIRHASTYCSDGHHNKAMTAITKKLFGRQCTLQRMRATGNKVLFVAPAKAGNQ